MDTTTTKGAETMIYFRYDNTTGYDALRIEELNRRLARIIHARGWVCDERGDGDDADAVQGAAERVISDYDTELGSQSSSN